MFSLNCRCVRIVGLIALGVEENLSGVYGWAAWQWLFLIEGVIPMIFALVDLIFVPASPEKLRFFCNEEEKPLILRRSRLAQNTSEIKFRPTLILVLFKDPVFWLCVCIFSGMTFASAAFTNFLPAIIKSFGWSSVTAQGMSVIPYAISAVTTIFWAFVSDRFGQRLLIMMTNILIAIGGFILFLTVHSRAALMVGGLLCPGRSTAWHRHHHDIHSKLAARSHVPSQRPGIALVNAFAQAVSISAGQAFRDPSRLYRKGNIIAMSMLAMAFVTCTGLRLYVTHVNKATSTTLQLAHPLLRHDTDTLSLLLKN
ncbi:hypothetical protein PRZ48_013347 [Zasmidium cellare]|uniref:Major facilitator superfamily (MFS) profile domain-containing protein n=1 Tax=Zasmidium cellare TaxID=395010 RepID=A0ABR0E0S7_ZASCE|nr:hypothetical protein PRZ48_013347 [Zasmidium cellare]